MRISRHEDGSVYIADNAGKKHDLRKVMGFQENIMFMAAQLYVDGPEDVKQLFMGQRAGLRNNEFAELNEKLDALASMDPDNYNCSGEIETLKDDVRRMVRKTMDSPLAGATVAHLKSVIARWENALHRRNTELSEEQHEQELREAREELVQTFTPVFIFLETLAHQKKSMG